jgi:hypothetical protein
MDECAQWKFWGRKIFCEELLKAVPDISVARPESSANFVELIAQVAIRFDLADPSVEEGVDQTIQAIVHRFYACAASEGRQDLDIETSRTANQLAHHFVSIDKWCRGQLDYGQWLSSYVVGSARSSTSRQRASRGVRV